MNHREQLERIRNVYGASVALVAYDLTQNIKTVRINHSAKAYAMPWPDYFGTQLAAFADETDGLFRVPQLWEAVSLWADGSLEFFGTWDDGDLNGAQLMFARELSRRFDELHLSGDPYLSARHVLATPRVLHQLCRLAGLEDNKSHDAVAILTGRAEKVVEDVERRFPRAYKASDCTASRPSFMQKAHAQAL